MKAITEVNPPKTTRTRQLLWFVGLWAAGVGTTALVSYGIRFWLK
jgi:hypothetical protein